MAPDLHRRSQLLVLDRERLIRYDEAANPFDDRKIGIDAIDRALKPLLPVGRSGDLRIGHEQSYEVRPAIMRR